MAHIETWYRCPVCDRLYDKQKEAITCRNNHPISVEQWAIGKSGKAVKVQENWSDATGRAMREADLSDNIHERARQLKDLIGGTSL